MTQADLTSRLENLYITLFGTVIGPALIADRTTIRQHCVHLDDDMLNEPLWHSFERLVGVALNDYDRHYVWTAKFHAVVTYLTFLTKSE